MTAMNTASTIYPNTYFQVKLDQETVYLFWNKESDEVNIISEDLLTPEDKVQIVPNPKLIYFIPNPHMTPRSEATYSVSKENSQIKLKYLDGHRFRNIVVHDQVA